MGHTFWLSDGPVIFIYDKNAFDALVVTDALVGFFTLVRLLSGTHYNLVRTFHVLETVKSSQKKITKKKRERAKR